MLRQMGLFGDPADPETNALVVKMLQLPETSQILDHLANQQQKAQEMQQQQMAMQEQQMAMQQQQAEAQMQPKQTFDPEAEQMKAEIEMQKQQMKSQADVEKLGIQSKAKQDEYAAQKVADLRHELMMKQLGGGENQGKPRPGSSDGNN